jgi:ATP-binding cassette subfamily C protein CydD
MRLNEFSSQSTSISSISQQQNQATFDVNHAREKHCVAWLKEKKNKVSWLINVVAFLGIINGLLVILQSAVLAFVFHQLIIEKQSWDQLLSSYVLLSIIFLLRNICHYYYQVLGYQAAATVKRSVREELLNKFSSLGVAYVKQQHSGELAATTLEFTEALEGYFSRYSPQQIIVSVLPLIMIAIVMPVNWVVAIIFLLTGPLIPLFMALVGMGAASANRSQFLSMAMMGGYFLDRLQGLTTLKLFQQAEAELQNIESVATAFREKTMAVLRIAFLSSAVLEFFSAVAVALVAVYVGLGLLGLIHFGPAINISLQEALFVLLLAPEFFNPLKLLASYYHDKAAAIGAADNILKVLESPNGIEADEQTVASNYCIELQNVSKNYHQKQVFKSFNLQIKAGEKIAITGESGVGKTTLFNLLMGFESVMDGTVLINGRQVSQENAAKNIAWAGPQASIFYASIRDNISLLDTNISAQQIDAAAKAAGVTEFSRNLEKGLLTLVGEQGYGLSGGQVQRIALARAFVKKVPIVLLDEPTAHLDEQNKASLLDAIDQLFEHNTVIIASHDPQVIGRMDREIKLA